MAGFKHPPKISGVEFIIFRGTNPVRHEIFDVV
jgi:hypothetical protein